MNVAMLDMKLLWKSAQLFASLEVIRSYIVSMNTSRSCCEQLRSQRSSVMSNIFALLFSVRCVLKSYPSTIQVNGTCWKKPIAFDCTMRKSSRLSRIMPNTEDSGTVLSSFAWNSGSSMRGDGASRKLGPSWLNTRLMRV